MLDSDSHNSEMTPAIGRRLCPGPHHIHRSASSDQGDSVVARSSCWCASAAERSAPHTFKSLARPLWIKIFHSFFDNAKYSKNWSLKPVAAPSEYGAFSREMVFLAKFPK